MVAIEQVVSEAPVFGDLWSLLPGRGPRTSSTETARAVGCSPAANLPAYALIDFSLNQSFGNIGMTNSNRRLPSPSGTAGAR